MKQTFYHIFRFIRDNNYRITFDEFTKHFTSHPDYPSLYAISDSLKHWNIEALVVQVPREELDRLPESFVAVTEEGGAQSIVYVRKKGDKILIREEKNKKTIDKDAFLHRWTGIILAIEPDTVKKGLRIPVSGVHYVLFFFALLAIVLRFVTGPFAFADIAFFAVCVLGIFISVLAIRETLGFFSGTVHKICNAGNRTSCGEVLSSRGAKVFGIFTLSDLCLVYFLSLGLVAVMVPGVSGALTTFVLAAAAVLLSLYSLYYQAVIVKKWCVLCLGITVLLYLQFTIVLLSSVFRFDYTAALVTLLVFALVTPGWLWVKENLEKLKTLENAEVDLLKLKRNKNVFRAILRDSDKIHRDTLKELFVPGIGKEEAPEMMYGVLSPSCIHCKTAFLNYADLIEEESGNMQFGILFNVNPENEKNPYLDVCYKVLEIHEKEGRENAVNALKVWYESGFELAGWQEKYGISNNDKYKAIVGAHYRWCKENNISYTPATIVREHIYPMDFAVKDLKFFIAD